MIPTGNAVSRILGQRHKRNLTEATRVRGYRRTIQHGFIVRERKDKPVVEVTTSLFGDDAVRRDLTAYVATLQERGFTVSWPGGRIITVTDRKDPA